jgi:nucleotide-binding universal stress UspA family protein
LDALLELHVVGNVTPLVHLPRGTPIWEISESVSAKEIDVVIMGISSRSTLARLFTGNAAERTLVAARCGVLTVKPDGFKAPVYMEGDLKVA